MTPPSRAGDEILWEVEASATLFIEPSAERAGTGRITFSVTGLDALLESLAARDIEHGAVETYTEFATCRSPIRMATRSPSPSCPTPSDRRRAASRPARSGG